MAWVLASGPGTLLHAVQLQRLFNDSKHFVDMPLKPDKSVDVLMSAFASLPLEMSPTYTHTPLALPVKAALQDLVEQFFLEPGSDLEEWTPHQICNRFDEDDDNGGGGDDWALWIRELQPRDVSEFAMDVYRLWTHLCRRVSDHVLYYPGHHTLLYLSQPFIIAGDRFRECYYWDSYWVVRGLMTCDMTDTAKDVVNNLLSLVTAVGHVPNGGRTYYKNRSQPPLLSAMVLCVSGMRREGPQSTMITQTTGLIRALGRAGGVQSTSGVSQNSVDTELLRYAFPRLIKTWQYWTSPPKAVRIVHDGAVHHMSRYHAAWDCPRPESYREDWDLAVSQFDLASPSGLASARTLWSELASAAESGWDFSSRWCHPDTPCSLASTRTTQIIPVDLNAFIAMLATDLAQIAQQLGELDAHSEFTRHAAERWESLHTLMWCVDDGCWHDLLITRCKAASPQHTTSHTTAHHSTPPGDTSVPVTFEEPVQAWNTAVRAHHASGGSDGSDVSDSDEEGQGDTALHIATQLRRQLASNWVPLWCGGVSPGSDKAYAAVNGLKQSGLLQAGGVATSMVCSGQQWDGDNVWPPLQHMMVESLRFSGVDGNGDDGGGGHCMAEQLAGRWLASVLAAYHSTGHMHEKYSASQPGHRGGGGEYEPQVGFGWTNGVVLDLLASGYKPTVGP